MENLGEEKPIRLSDNGNYTRDFIDQVVAELESGKSAAEVRRKYGLKEATLYYWITNYSSKDYRENRRKILPVYTKRSIVRAVKNGSMSIHEAMTIYNIKSTETIKRWILAEKRQMSELVNSNQLALKKEQSNEQTSHLKPADQTEDLRRKLADAELKIAALNTLIDVAEEQLKINIRKKPGAKQS